MSISFSLVYLSNALLVLDRTIEVEHSDDLERFLSHLGVSNNAFGSTILIVLFDFDTLRLEVVVEEPR